MFRIGRNDEPRQRMVVTVAVEQCEYEELANWTDRNLWRRFLRGYRLVEKTRNIEYKSLEEKKKKRILAYIRYLAGKELERTYSDSWSPRTRQFFATKTLVRIDALVEAGGDKRTFYDVLAKRISRRLKSEGFVSTVHYTTSYTPEKPEQDTIRFGVKRKLR